MLRRIRPVASLVDRAAAWSLSFPSDDGTKSAAAACYWWDQTTDVTTMPMGDDSFAGFYKASYRRLLGQLRVSLAAVRALCCIQGTFRVWQLVCWC